jgi:hypothetical protein
MNTRNETSKSSRLSKWITALAAGAALIALAPAASATVLNFDDITSDDLMSDISGGHYGGLDWSGSDWIAFTEEDAPYTPSSGSTRLVTNFGDTDAATTIRFDAPSTFQGAAFAGLEGAKVTFDLFFQGKQVFTSATLDPSATPSFLASGYAGLVDEVIVSSVTDGQGNFAMDDFTFNTAVQAVPEPETYALMLAGLGAVGAIARRRKPRA